MESDVKIWTPAEATRKPLPDMGDVCKALVENAVEFLEKNYGDAVLEQITDMVMMGIKYGDGSGTADVVRRFDKSFKNEKEN